MKKDITSLSEKTDKDLQGFCEILNKQSETFGDKLESLNNKVDHDMKQMKDENGNDLQTLRNEVESQSKEMKDELHDNCFSFCFTPNCINIIKCK